MPQFKYQADAAAAKNAEDNIKEAGSRIAGVKWINVNPSGLIVVTAGEDFDSAAFLAAVQPVESSIVEA